MRRLFLIFSVVALCSSLPAQHFVGEKFMQKGNFGKARDLIEYSLVKNPQDVSALYGAYKLYSAPTPARDDQKAFGYICKAYSAYQSAAPDVRSSLDASGLTAEVLKAEAESACSPYLERAIRINTMEGFQHFLSTCPLASDAQRAEAVERMSDLAYRQVMKRNVLQDYRVFMQDYPVSRHVPEARDRVYALAWDSVRRANDRGGYVWYVASYPDSPCREEAQRALSRLDFEAAMGDSAWVLSSAVDSVRQRRRRAWRTIVAYVNVYQASELYQDQSLPRCLRDSLQTLVYSLIGGEGNIEDMERVAADSRFPQPLRTTMLLRLRFLFMNASPLNALSFHQRHTEACVERYRSLDLSIRSAYQRLNRSNRDSLVAFIRLAAPFRVAYRELQRLLRSSIEGGDYAGALSVARGFAREFGEDGDYAALLSTLAAAGEGIVMTPFPPTVNSPGTRHACSTLSADGRTLYYMQKGVNEDIYVSYLSDSTWSQGVPVPGLSDSVQNESPMVLSVDGTRLIVFKNGMLCEVDKTAEGWGRPVPLPDNINVGTWQADACLSADGSALLFAARKRTGYEPDVVADLYDSEPFRGSNIFVSLKGPDGAWGRPIDLGATINTPWTDRSPFLHADGRTLVFASEGHGSLGGEDLFVSRRLSADSWTEWSEPVSLGREINTVENDWDFKVSTDGLTGYLANADGLVSCSMPVRLRPDRVATVRGRLLDEAGNPVNVSIRWEDLESHLEVGQSHTDPVDGSYYMVLPLGRLYGYYVEDTAYFPISSNLDLRQTSQAVSVQQDLQTASVRQMTADGAAVRMNNLFFAYGRSDLDETSRSELQRVADFLRRENRPVEVAGYTDNQGSASGNQSLSERRAAAVRDYLVRMGCRADLLTAVGYGSQHPVASNDTEQGRTLNRRVEIRFLKK